MIDLNFDQKPQIRKREFQQADVKKTHGNNIKIKNFVNKKNFFNIKKALNNTCSWYKEN